MPVYGFECPECAERSDRFFSVADYEKQGESQKCGDCGAIMHRYYTPTNFSVCADGDTWNPGLGCKQKDLQSKKKQIEDETGMDIQEVGNETAVAPERKSDYSLNEQEKAFIQNLGSD